MYHPVSKGNYILRFKIDNTFNKEGCGYITNPNLARPTFISKRYDDTEMCRLQVFFFLPSAMTMKITYLPRYIYVDVLPTISASFQMRLTNESVEF